MANSENFDRFGCLEKITRQSPTRNRALALADA
jgi:hypothetical protein